MYRKPFKTEEPKEPGGGFKYILIEESNVNATFYHHYCTVCKTMNTGYDAGGLAHVMQVCMPNKRVQFKGKFWQKRFCPLGGYHKHYHCYYCGVASILPLQSDKIISAEFNEDT